MKISYNPIGAAAVTTTAAAVKNDILFDLGAKKIWAKGLRMGADWEDISSKPSSLKNPYALTISLNGTSQGPYDGSAAKNINITPSSIGAATSGHNHDGRYVYNYGGTQMDANSLNKNALGMSSNSGITGGWWCILQASWNSEYRWNSQIAFPTQNKKGMYYRSGLDNNTAWGDWVKLLDISNSYVTEGKGYINSTEITQVNNASKLQTARNLWGNSFDGTKDINGSIIFPDIGDTAISNKISWSGSSDGADIYYQTTGKDQGNLVLNVKDDTNAYIQLALNGVFKSHFDVANSYWTGRSAQADKWTTARTFTIGNTAKNVDGSGNVSWSLAEIGVKDTWRAVQVNGTSIGNNTLNLCGSTYIGLTNVNGKVTFSLVGSGTTANQAILSNGTANGWTLKTLNIANWDTAYNLRHSHTNKSVLDGITSGLVNNWNTAFTFVNTITGTDTDNVINKWNEIVNFLADIREDNTLNTLLNSKLSVYELANNTNVGAIKNNGIYYSTTDVSSNTLTNSPFNNGFALINMTSYDGGDDLVRSRLAFNAYGEIKVSNDRDKANTAETWYNVLTSKNSGIDGSTITLNGTSITVCDSATADSKYVKKIGDTMSGSLTIDTGNFGALVIKRNNSAGGAVIQFSGDSDAGVYGYIGLDYQNKDKQLLRWKSDALTSYAILDTSSTYVSNGVGTINGTTITKVANAVHADEATKIMVYQNTDNNSNFPLVWAYPNYAQSFQSWLYKSQQDLYYNPKSKMLTVAGSINTTLITATNTITSAGFIHSGVNENPEQYVLTADGGCTLLNQTSNEPVREFNKNITVTSEWMDIDEFYGGNNNFLTQSGTYIVQVYVNDTDDGIWENYFSGIMSWYTGHTNSNNSDEIILHRVGHDYSNTIYLRTKESPTPGYAKLQISANTNLLHEHIYTFKFKRIC